MSHDNLHETAEGPRPSQRATGNAGLNPHEAHGLDAATGPGSGDIRILVAEDDPRNRQRLLAMLHKLGYEVLAAEDGEQAVNIFQAHHPDLVLMDVMMPLMNGYQATRRIKDMAGERFVPVIFITGFTDEEALLKCIEAGGDDFVSKPLNQVILQAKIDALLRVRALYRTQVAQKKELRRAKEVAEAATKAKSAFLAAMSHEIRTPLTAVIGIATLLGQTKLEKEQREFVDTIQTSSNNLLSIINDILDMAKIESGRLHIERVPFDLGQIIRDCVTLFEPAARQKGIGLAAEYSAAVPRRLVGDPTRVRQVILNLVGNAIKFTRHGGVAIRVACEQSDQVNARMRIVVQDTGIGIAADALTGIFDTFSQADASTTRRFGGSGLGLAICKEIVELMGGTISAHSRVGEGTSFATTLSFPLDLEDRAAPPSESQEAWLPSDAARIPVLVVEDNVVNQKVAAAMLKKLGCQVDVAQNGLEAIQQFETHRYAAIFMDCQMPEMDGFEATTEIRRRETGPRVPIIAMTANALQEDRDRCLAIGMDDYLSKPVRPGDFRRALVRWTQDWLSAEPQPPGQNASRGEGIA